MLQHYSVSWKKGLAALCLLAVAGLSGCDQKENAAAKVEYDGPFEQPTAARRCQ
ncbi:putative lipoprotein [Escherichia coli]|nr:putative lipoprotein [Escherichia coli]